VITRGQREAKRGREGAAATYDDVRLDCLGVREARRLAFGVVDVASGAILGIAKGLFQFVHHLGVEEVNDDGSRQLARGPVFSKDLSPNLSEGSPSLCQTRSSHTHHSDESNSIKCALNRRGSMPR